jgi:uncharacterized membrane protein
MGKDRTGYYLWGLIGAYIIVMAFLSLNRHYTFRTCAFDLGIFAQSLWTTATGDGLLYNTVEQYVMCVDTHFGIHFSPILLTLVPIYRLFPYPETLLVLQSVIVGISAYPLFLLSRELIGDDIVSLLLVVIYLSNSLLHGITLFDFHEAPLAMPFIFLTALYFERGEYRKAALSSFLILSVKEDAGLSLISLGLFYLLKDRNILNVGTYADILKRALKRELNDREKWSVILGITGVLMVLLTWKVVIPWVAGVHFPFFLDYRRPHCPAHLFMKTLYFIVANLTLGLLTFLRPKYTLLLTFAPWVEILASCEWNFYRIGFHYPYMLLPLSFIAIVYSFKEFSELNKREILRKIVLMGLIIGVTASIFTTPALPLNDPIKYDLLVPPFYYEPITKHDRLLMRITDVLDDTNFSILTQNDIFPHLADRPNTYLIWASYCGNKLPHADVILVDDGLLYSMYNYRLKDYLGDYMGILELDGIKIWIRNDILNTPEAGELIRELQKLKS